MRLPSNPSLVEKYLKLKSPKAREWFLSDFNYAVALKSALRGNILCVLIGIYGLNSGNSNLRTPLAINAVSDDSIEVPVSVEQSHLPPPAQVFAAKVVAQRQKMLSKPTKAQLKVSPPSIHPPDGGVEESEERLDSEMDEQNDSDITDDDENAPPESIAADHEPLVLQWSIGESAASIRDRMTGWVKSMQIQQVANQGYTEPACVENDSQSVKMRNPATGDEVIVYGVSLPCDSEIIEIPNDPDPSKVGL